MSIIQHRQVKIGHKQIGLEFPPFIIAEMSANHNHSLERAMKIAHAAAEAGAHALKLQTYTPDTMTLDIRRDEFMIDDTNGLWTGKSLYELYQDACMLWEWHEPIFKKCKELGIICFSTPFDETAVDFLMDLDCPAFKIASFENTDLPLIEKIASTGKPIIISTGMATVGELDEAVRIAKYAGCRDIILLKCTSTYPADPSASNLKTIPHMRTLFNCETGISDHTPGIGTAVASVALGATVIEKHFTLDRAGGGVDSAFSLEPQEMRQLVEESKRAWQALGNIHYGPTIEEEKSLIFRRSLYIVKDLEKGDILSPENMRAIRPGKGLSPKYYYILLGKKVKYNIKRGTPVNWDIIE